jgi:hypothetical protein
MVSSARPQPSLRVPHGPVQERAEGRVGAVQVGPAAAAAARHRPLSARACSDSPARTVWVPRGRDVHPRHAQRASIVLAAGCCLFSCALSGPAFACPWPLDKPSPKTSQCSPPPTNPPTHPATPPKTSTAAAFCPGSPRWLLLTSPPPSWPVPILSASPSKRPPTVSVGAGVVPWNCLRAHAGFPGSARHAAGWAKPRLKGGPGLASRVALSTQELHPTPPPPPLRHPLPSCNSQG